MIKQNKKTIMIIDDDEDGRDFFCLALRKINKFVKIICCNSGEDAIEYFNSYSIPIPDYIFLDLKMPKMDGKQTLIELNKIKKTVNCPIIIYSSTKSKTDEEEVKTLGAKFFLTKPYRFKDLVDSISIILKRVEIPASY